jgi:hypothetical protein
VREEKEIGEGREVYMVEKRKGREGKKKIRKIAELIYYIRSLSCKLMACASPNPRPLSVSWPRGMSKIYICFHSPCFDQVMKKIREEVKNENKTESKKRNSYWD